jgi:selenocysteine lyase/cysteine desulfurase
MGIVGAGRHRRYHTAVVAPFLPDAEKLAAVREGLPAVGAGIYLDTPMAGPLPAETARAMQDIESWELGTGRAGRDRRAEAVGRIDEARAAAATLLAADLDEILLAHGLDDAVARAIRTIEWQPGDRAVVVAEPGGLGLAAALPAGVEVAELPVPVGSEAIGAAVERALRPAARLVACPLVSAATGARLPVEEIAAMARDRGATVLVDVTQVAGTAAVDRRALGADLVVARSEAWMLGPEGLAVMAAPADRIERAAPPGDPVRGVGSGHVNASGKPDGPIGFHLPSVVGFGRSCGWLSMYVGLSWIEARARQLARDAASRLAAIPGVEVLTPTESAGCIVVFRVAGWPSESVLDELGARIFLLASSVADLDAVRIGTGFFNTETEIDRLVEGVGLIAAHRPGTLPPRRSLAILGEAP